MTKEEAMEYIDECLVLKIDDDEYEAVTAYELRRFYEEYPPNVVDDAIAGTEQFSDQDTFEANLKVAKNFDENRRSLEFVDHTNFEFYHFDDGIPVSRAEARTRLMTMGTDAPWFGRKVKVYHS